MKSRSDLKTEKQNPKTTELDVQSTNKILRLINNEDQTVALAVKDAIPSINETVSICVTALKSGHRIFYIGAGTSGRLGVLDASEIPPTFSGSPEWFTGIIAGGERALKQSIEGAEDIPENGREDIKNAQVERGDVVIGISTSGAASYVRSALEYAHQIGAKTSYIICNSAPYYPVLVDSEIKVDTGEEVVTGSTRMKAGTATKMVLNMISTTTMIKLGKVYKNLMVDLMTVNKKLVDRGIRIIIQITDTDYENAKYMLLKSENSVKKAIIMIQNNCSKIEAEKILHNADGFLRKCIKEN
jgi:N-acetylmuramic acid 6-phosphate etherase